MDMDGFYYGPKDKFNIRNVCVMCLHVCSVSSVVSYTGLAGRLRHWGVLCTPVVSYTGLGQSTSSLGCMCVFVDQYVQYVYRIQMYIYNLVVQILQVMVLN